MFMIVIFNKIKLRHITTNFLSTTFYDLKVTFGYTGESPENFYVKIMSILRINIVFFGPNMAASQLPYVF